MDAEGPVEVSDINGVHEHELVEWLADKPHEVWFYPKFKDLPSATAIWFDNPQHGLMFKLTYGGE